MGIGTNLKRLRSKTKYSSKDIADLLEIDRNTYSNWENEATDVKSQYIPKLADIFNVKIQDLFDDGQKTNIINNIYDNKDSSVGQKDIQQGIIINITDSETAKLLSSQLEELIKNLKK
ncbi:helix-turn-helix transcriptional regulator [Chryseobacterium sp.]|jgi:transcriptional regulator with XRE-family HTH domain|uniref:helix-turn-helix domain-containing protein n=1 Tax=Chryseobacterium sp. TaxID=1871047 RepID=UPI0026270A2B|nr:helix-turn-helix transcriptional regulator [Chryseobacterium sp.]